MNESGGVDEQFWRDVEALGERVETLIYGAGDYDDAPMDVAMKVGKLFSELLDEYDN